MFRGRKLPVLLSLFNIAIKNSTSLLCILNILASHFLELYPMITTDQSQISVLWLKIYAQNCKV